MPAQFHTLRILEETDCASTKSVLQMLQSCASPPTTLLGSDHGVHHEHPLQGEYQVPFQLAGPCGADFRARRAAASEAYLRQTQSDPLCSRLAATVSHGEPLSQVFRPPHPK